jgi:hypothetical protein
MSKEIFHVLRSDQFGREFLDELYGHPINYVRLRAQERTRLSRKSCLTSAHALFHAAIDQNILSFLNACQILVSRPPRSATQHIIGNEGRNSGGCDQDLLKAMSI